MASSEPQNIDYITKAYKYLTSEVLNSLTSVKIRGALACKPYKAFCS